MKIDRIAWDLKQSSVPIDGIALRHILTDRRQASTIVDQSRGPSGIGSDRESHRTHDRPRNCRSAESLNGEA